MGEPRRAGASVIRRYIAWRNRHAQDRVLREVVKRGAGILYQLTEGGQTVRVAAIRHRSIAYGSDPR